MQAHEELVRSRPSREASLVAWLQYYRRSVALYEQIAEIDPNHAGEAMYWAQREQRRIDEITDQINRERPRY
jgi:hypothetical protein